MEQKIKKTDIVNLVCNELINFWYINVSDANIILIKNWVKWLKKNDIYEIYEKAVKKYITFLKKEIKDFIKKENIITSLKDSKWRTFKISLILNNNSLYIWYSDWKYVIWASTINWNIKHLWFIWWILWINTKISELYKKATIINI